MKLRDYQIKGIEAIREKFLAKKKRVVFRLSTGGGKSLIFTYLAVESVKKGKTVLIICDRWELIAQAQAHVRKHGINPIMITPKWKGQVSNCYVASVQTLNRRSMPAADLIILDEAHKNAFSRILKNPLYDNSFIVGMTATPISTPKFDLSTIYDDMVEVIEIDKLIEQGFLVNAKYFAAWENLGKLKVKGEEYDQDELFEKFNNNKMYDGMIDAYLQHTPNTKAICFCINVEHAIKTCQQFESKGIKAVMVVADTQYCSEEERKERFKQFEQGDAMILVNVGIATTGYDYPPTQTVILNKKTKSLALYLQMLGRGSRPYNNKKYFNVIDMGSNIIEHGWYDDVREWSLTPKRKSSGKKGLAPIKECLNPECGCLIPAVSKICKFCGFVFPEEVTKLATSEGIVEIKKEAIPQLPKELLGKHFHQMSIQELETIRSIKSYKLGWIVRILSERGSAALTEYGRMRGFTPGWDKHYHKTKHN